MINVVRIAIVGAGAVGGTLACYLTLYGSKVVLLARGRSLEAAKGGFYFEGPMGVRRGIKVEVVGEPNGDVDVVIYATKAYDLMEAAEGVSESGWGEAFQMTLQNGLGNEEALAEVFGREKTLSSVIYISAERVRPGAFRHLSGGRIYMGSLWMTKEKKELLGLLRNEISRTPIRVEVVDDIRYWIFRKLLWNASFNPITALLNMEIDFIVRIPEALILAKRIMGEIDALVKAIGINLGEEVIEKTVSATIEMGGGETSMLADLRRGRRMEIEAILGRPLQMGERMGVEMTTLKTIYEILTSHPRGVL
ncbi:MAG: ketopantoate reductase family protein [Thermoplasmata archaeon]|nr:ketopantoate reductase family protein [Thermoplasmata archaeon]